MAEPKYNPENLLPMLRLAAKLRNRMLKAGFTDNGGAIHSAERILDILSQRVKYPALRHGNSYKNQPYAEFSPSASEDYDNGVPVFLEHVAPIRDYTREVIKRMDRGDSDRKILNFINRNYQLVLLSSAETKLLNSTNRSKMNADRLKSAGINKLIRKV